MALEDYRADQERCSLCSYCKWIPQDKIKSWRFAKGCPSIAYNNFNGKMRVVRADFVHPGLMYLSFQRDLYVEIPDISSHGGILETWHKTHKDVKGQDFCFPFMYQNPHNTISSMTFSNGRVFILTKQTNALFVFQGQRNGK